MHAHCDLVPGHLSVTEVSLEVVQHASGDGRDSDWLFVVVFEHQDHIDFSVGHGSSLKYHNIHLREVGNKRRPVGDGHQGLRCEGHAHLSPVWHPHERHDSSRQFNIETFQVAAKLLEGLVVPFLDAPFVLFLQDFVGVVGIRSSLQRQILCHCGALLENLDVTGHFRTHQHRRMQMKVKNHRETSLLAGLEDAVLHLAVEQVYLRLPVPCQEAHSVDVSLHVAGRTSSPSAKDWSNVDLTQGEWRFGVL
mmetsp:Transcript_47833/g.103089  ORF Transcript_47833/g.103089 Transcript_47833/m.103089 type:complete len:250 (+) Transcript_47833:1065-1814(+)